MRFRKQADGSYVASLFSDNSAQTITQLLEANGFAFTVRSLIEGRPELILNSKEQVERFATTFRGWQTSLNNAGNPWIDK